MSVGHRNPASAVVIGAGIVGLSVAWFLQESGVQVTVVERGVPGRGSSWGNAGWLSPGLAVPLPEPAVLRYGLRSLLDRTSALYVPPSLDPALWAFLARFARHCTIGHWKAAMRGYLGVNDAALAAYDRLAAAGVSAETVKAPVIAAFRNRSEAAGLRRELEMMAAAGQHLETVELDEAAARDAAPQLSWRIGYALELLGQRYIDPGQFVASLATAVVDRGGTMRAGFEVTDVASRFGGGITVSGADEQISADVAVLATGAWLSRLATRVGVRVAVRAGRGYSFGVRTVQAVPCPVYFPLPRVACTPYQGGLRIGGTMEFASADDPAHSGRLEALLSSAQPLLTGVDWDSISGTWVGSRPITPDGMALIGATDHPGVFVAGGHGMWGVTLGPITGQLLAEQIVTGIAPEALAPFDPRR